MKRSLLPFVNTRSLLRWLLLLVFGTGSANASYTDVSLTGSLSGGGVWGSSPYTSDSDLARAAVHAGVIAVGETKLVRVTYGGPQNSFVGSTSNGITSSSYGYWPESFTLSLASAAHPPTVTLNFDSSSWMNGASRQAATATPINVTSVAGDSDGDLWYHRIYWSDGQQDGFWSSSPGWPNGTVSKMMPSSPTTLQVRAEAWDVGNRYTATPWQTIQVVTPPGNLPPTAGVWGPAGATYGQSVTYYYSATDPESQLASWTRIGFAATSGVIPISGSYRFEAVDAQVYSNEVKLEVRDVHNQLGSKTQTINLLPYVQSEVDPENWTGRIVNLDSKKRSICPRREECTVRSSKPASVWRP